MLVLSRRPDQSITFPELDINVKVISVKGSLAKLGISAPKAIKILRDELGKSDSASGGSRSLPASAQQLRHKFRNDLNMISVGLHLLKTQLEYGCHEDAVETVQRLLAQSDRINSDPLLATPHSSAKQPSQKTALLVDDEANEREMLAGFLRMHSYKVATAADGEEAIKYLESHEQPSIVIMDMRMPRCDGPTTIRRIRENPAFDQTKIFGLSASTAEENRIDLREEGISGWFMKPLNPELLVDAMSVKPEDQELSVARLV